MSSSTQKIMEAQQLLAWGNRVAARRHLIVALQENPHDAQLWFLLAQTLDNQAHVINALERALKYDVSLLEAQRYLDLLRTVMDKNQAPQTGRASVVRPDSSKHESSPDEAAVVSDAVLIEEEKSSEDEDTTSKTAPPPEEHISHLTIDAALDTNKMRSLEGEATTAPDSEPKPSGLTTKKFAIKAAPTRPFSAPEGLPLQPDDDDATFEHVTEQDKKTAPPQPQKSRLRRAVGCFMKILLLLLVMGGLFLLSWYIVSHNLLPEQAVNANPAVATQVAVIRENVPPFPEEINAGTFSLNLMATESAVPEWVREAQKARYNNNINEADQILRNNLKNDPNNIAGLLALSDLRREQAGGEGEALKLAERALDIINTEGTLEERAQASQRYVWAMARQAQPDIGLALARGEQAATETPDNPYALWAHAMAASLEGDTSIAWKATQRATSLSGGESIGVIEAQQAEIYAQLGDLEQAAQRYKAALEKTDYVPWRVTLVRILREQERFDEAQKHLDHLRQLAPNEPAVQQLES